MKYVVLLLFFHLGYSQNIELKIETIIENHIEDYMKSKSFDNLIVSYKNGLFSKTDKSSNVIVLNEKANVRKLIKKDTNLIIFKTIIKDNKLFITAIHFKLKKIKNGVEYINQTDGKDYYICDLVEKSAPNVDNVSD